MTEEVALPGVTDLSRPNLMTFLRGQRSLRAAWGFWFLGCWALSMVILVLGIAIGMPVAGDDGFLWALEHRGMLLAPFSIVGLFAVWQCASNAKRRFWYFGARVIVVILAFGTVGAFVERIWA